MAIVKMSKLNLVAMSYHRDAILNTLQKTGCVDISSSVKEVDDDFSQTDAFSCNENLQLTYDKLVKAIDFFYDCADKCKGKPYLPLNLKALQSNLIVSFDEFSSISSKERLILDVVNSFKDIESKLVELRNEKVKLSNTFTQVQPYSIINHKFYDFHDTKTSKVFFGTVKSENLKTLNDFFSDFEFAQFTLLGSGNLPIICVVCLNEFFDNVNKKLNEAGFSKCQFIDRLTPQQKLANIQSNISSIDAKTEQLYKSIFDYTNDVKDIEILADYYKFLIEKDQESAKFSYTASTFTLTGYVPEDKREQVTCAINQISQAVFVEFVEPSPQDNPPTLTKNDKLVSQVEFVTDMYSVPRYNEVDPNKSVFFFFMLFMGVIMADVGYGLLMLVVGAILSFRIKVPNGAKKLWNVIAISGVFTIAFGVLFNSLFGYAVLPFTLLPSPVTGTIDDIMIILLLCLLLGVIQIAFGYFMKALNCFKNRQILDGIFDGIIWVTFFIGFFFAVFNFILDYLMTDSFVLDAGIRQFFDKMQLPGLITLGVSLGIAVLTAGRHEKGFGKFSKGFGAVYGLINIMSDILSYARLFGLMLSGMIIASTFNDIGGLLMNDGGVMVVLGGLVIVVGHTFNIAMGVLGAYIHDSRLQYIEYFSKFYTGEGEKFSPIGSKFNYIYLTK